jgi:hypothetical protein
MIPGRPGSTGTAPLPEVAAVGASCGGNPGDAIPLTLAYGPVHASRI